MSLGPLRLTSRLNGVTAPGMLLQWHALKSIMITSDGAIHLGAIGRGVRGELTKAAFMSGRRAPFWVGPRRFLTHPTEDRRIRSDLGTLGEVAALCPSRQG